MLKIVRKIIYVLAYLNKNKKFIIIRIEINNLNVKLLLFSIIKNKTKVFKSKKINF